MSKNRAPVSWVDPTAYRAGAEWIKSTRHPKEPRDGDPIHAVSFTVERGFAPVVERRGVSSEMRIKAWCGVRLRLVLPELFDDKSSRACAACLHWMKLGYPEQGQLGGRV